MTSLRADRPAADRPIIVGAGISGLVAAAALAQRGARPLVVESSSRPGGRLATERVGTGSSAAVFDHGAQFFTVRSKEFAVFVDDWRRHGLVREWCRGFRGEGDGYPRYVIEGGMASLADELVVRLRPYVDFAFGMHVHALTGANGQIGVMTNGREKWASPVVLVTAPVPNSLALCENGWLPLPEDAEASLRLVHYAPCFALLVAYDGPSPLPAPGGVQLEALDDPTFSFIADNRSKGISERGAITFHTNDAFSFARFDDDIDDVRAELVGEATRWLGATTPHDVAVKRWRYARPLVGHPEACVVTEPIDDTCLVFAGDAFGGAKVEGAVLSGLAAAEAALSR